MQEETKKKAPVKKTAVKSEKPVAKTEKKAAAKSSDKTASGKTVTLVQTGSPIGRQGYQRSTLIGLGLNKLGRTRTLQDTPSVRGMIAKVRHLIKVVGEEKADRA